MKKFFNVLLLSILCFFLSDNFIELKIFAAESTSIEGVEVSISSDKKEYASADDVKISFTIENKSKADIKDVEWNLDLPDGLKVKSENLTRNDISIKTGENYQGSVILEKDASLTTSATTTLTTTTTVTNITYPKADSSKTGDDSNISIILTIMIITAIIAVFSSKKNKKLLQIFSLMICLVFIATSNPIEVFASNEQTLYAKVDRDIKIDGIQYKIGLNVKLNIKIEEIEQKMIDWETLLGIPENVDLSDANENNIPDAIEGKLEEDSDGDGLSDIAEKIYKTDPNLNDTDSDKLPDGYEMLKLKTDPLKPDSDNNGISDADEDPDLDGLSNINEYKSKSDPFTADTDKDGINDADEVNKHKTSPILKDTDYDGLNDNDELNYGMDPNKEDTLGDGVKDGERLFTVTVLGEKSDNQKIAASINVELKGNQIESLSINKVSDENVFLNSTIPGYLGNAYDLNVNGNFETATLSFELEPSLFNNPDFEPTIYYWNSDEQILLELENQMIEGNTVSAVLEHFSSYIIIDKTHYMQSFLEFIIEPPVEDELQNNRFDIFFALDESGSITSDEFQIMKNSCVELIDCLSDNDRVGIITFGDMPRKRLDLSEKETVKRILPGYYKNGGSTALYSAINKSVNLLKNTTDSSRLVIVLADGDDNNSFISCSDAVNRAIANNIVVYTIGIGSNVNQTILTNIANNTGGHYYPIDDFNDITNALKHVFEDSDIYKDTDEDGVSDYYEKCIEKGQLKLGTGATVPNFSSLKYLSDDSDGDELFDGEEIEIKEITVDGNTTCYCYMYSNPCLIDTDNDGLNDNVENYAGFDMLNNESLLDFDKIPDNFNFDTNKYEDWKELTKDHAWNYIHIRVQDDLVENNKPFLKKEQGLKNKDDKRIASIDLINLTLGLIWEVKPASYRTEPNRSRGIDQLNKYINIAKEPQNNLILDIGKYEIGEYGRIEDDPEYEIDYFNNGDGLVTYHFKKKSKEPVEVAVKENETEEEQDEKSVKAWLWEKAKDVGYNCAEFGDFIIDQFKDAPENIRDHIEEIVNTGIAIGGFFGIMYIIAYLWPLMVFA